MAGGFSINPASNRQDQKPAAVKGRRSEQIFSGAKSAGFAAGRARHSWLRANRSRSLGNLATRGSSLPIAARSAGIARGRAREPAQDAAWRNRERATNDFSDGQKVPPGRPLGQVPSTRKPHIFLRPRVLDGTRFPGRTSARRQPRKSRSDQARRRFDAWQE